MEIILNSILQSLIFVFILLFICNLIWLLSLPLHWKETISSAQRIHCTNKFIGSLFFSSLHLNPPHILSITILTWLFPLVPMKSAANFSHWMTYLYWVSRDYWDKLSGEEGDIKWIHICIATPDRRRHCTTLGSANREGTGGEIFTLLQSFEQ